MADDTQILLLCYIVYWITLAFIVLKSKHKIRTIVLNLAIQIIYSMILLYNLEYNSAGGAGLAWLVYLMLIIAVHWLLNMLVLINKGFNNNK